jgi:hypothetical protein
MTMQAEDERLGRICYEAYCTNTGWVSLISGEVLPQWDDMTDALKTAWIAAAREVVANG